MIAIGYYGDPASLPEKSKLREEAPRATVEQLQLVHPAAYVEKILALAPPPGSSLAPAFKSNAKTTTSGMIHKPSLTVFSSGRRWTVSDMA